MIVKFKKSKKYRNLISNKAYIAYAIGLKSNELLVSIKDNDADLIFCPIDEFEMINQDIPPDWKITISDQGDVYLEPKEFVENFWDNLYSEDDSIARSALYKAEKKINIFHRDRTGTTL